MKILVINSGSSSLKYQLFDMTTGDVLAKGLCERIGGECGIVTHKRPGHDPYKAEPQLPDHGAALSLVLGLITDKELGVIADISEIEAVGHRVAHGGEMLRRSSIIGEKELEYLYSIVDINPLHGPPAIKGIEACRKLLPSVPQVGVFDTSYYSTIPDYTYICPLPYEYYEKYKIRRYGFHGTSHRYVSKRAIAMLGGKAEGTRIVTCHLGNGASLSAIVDGKCLDTTMGVTPLEGIMMGTRCGNIDPAIIPYLMRKGEITTADDVDKLLNKKSGMLGVCGITSDNQEIGNLAAEGNERCQLTVDMYKHQLAKNVGSYITCMGGTDAIVFTGGIGENAGEYRTAVCEKLAFMGVKIDEAKNKIRGEEVEISTPDSTIKVYVIPTNEELMIARDTLEIVNGLK